MSSFPDEVSVSGPWKIHGVLVFCGSDLPKWPEIYGLSIGCDPNHLPLTNWEVGWLEDHFFPSKKMGAWMSHEPSKWLVNRV